MTIKDIIWLLAHSKEPEDRREWAVLYWKYQGLTHRVVAEKLSHGKDWVQRYMTSAYKRFGAPEEFDRDEKWEWLEKNVFPALKEFLEDNPDTVKDLPEPDKVSIEGVPPPPPPPEPPVIIIDSPKQLPGTTGHNYIRLIILLIVLGGLVSTVGYLAYNLGRRFAPNSAPIPPITAITAVTQVITEVLPPAPIPSIVPSSVPTNIPTDTQVPTPPPTETLVPTVFVPPANGILFQDNFDNGISTDWTIYNGKWLIANGKLTVISDGNYDWIGLDRPQWKNYIISLVVNIPFQGGGGQSPVAILLNNNSQPKNLGIVVLYPQSTIYWALISSDNSSPVAGDNSPFYFMSGSTLELEVQNNNYTIRVNRQEIQTISLTGYGSGGLTLGTNCVSNASACPSFSDIKVTYLP